MHAQAPHKPKNDRVHLGSPLEASFDSTLTRSQRRLAGRLEGFGDIVFGFAVSQCALQLPTVRGHVDLTHPLALLFYLGTFTLLASLWLTYHRLLSVTYVPSGVDLVLAFAFLAVVSLMPYAMYSVSHQTATFEDARAAVAEYAILFAMLMAIAAFIGIRNLRRGWWYLDDDERRTNWVACVRRCFLCGVMAAATGVDLIFGPTISTIPFLTIPIGLRLIRVFVKRTPTTAALRVTNSPPSPAPSLS